MQTDRKILLGGIALFLLFATFLWSALTVVSPILIGGILLYILSELKDLPLIRKLQTGIGLMLLIWILLNAQGIVIPFIIAFLLAYLANPLVDFFERIRLPRLLGVIVVFLAAFGLLTLGAVILLPDLAKELQDLIVRLPQTIQNVITLAHKHLPKLFGLLKIDYLKLEQDFLQNKYPAKVEQLLIQALKILWGMGTWLSRLLNVILIPVLTFYFLKDYSKIKTGLLSLIPRKYKSLACFYLWRSNRIVGGYIRGQLIVCVFVGVLTWFGLFLFSIPYAILIGIVAGLLNIVPFVGLYVSLGLALMSAIFTPVPHIAAIKILGVFVVVQSVEAYVISPKIVGDRVGLHPIAVIFSILIFSRFMGFWGLLIAVPAAALIKFALDERKRHQNWKELLAAKIQFPNA